MTLPLQRTKPNRVFISYSQDSPEHQERVRALAVRLREEGVDARMDLFDPNPPNGWPLWMEQEIRLADFVLLICTETYLRRVELREEPGKGRGVLWESKLIYNALYSVDPDKQKFIPVLLADCKTDWIPSPVRGLTRYNVDTPDGYDQLYRYLTNQPAYPLTPLGPQKTLPPLTPVQPPSGTTTTKSSLAFILRRDPVVMVWLPVVEAQWTREIVTMTVHPFDNADASILDDIVRARTSIIFAYQYHVAIGRLQKVIHQHTDGIDRYDLALQVEQDSFIDLFTDVAYADNSDADHLSVEVLAELRARRLLLHEQPAPATVPPLEQLREACIQGISTECKVIGSPFPELYAHFADQPLVFLEAAWITAVAQLHLGHVVTSVDLLELSLLARHLLKVRFSGRRHETRISVEGTCKLALATETASSYEPLRGPACTITDAYAAEQYRGVAIRVAISNEDEQSWQLTHTTLSLFGESTPIICGPGPHNLSPFTWTTPPLEVPAARQTNANFFFPLGPARVANGIPATMNATIEFSFFRHDPIRLPVVIRSLAQQQSTATTVPGDVELRVEERNGTLVAWLFNDGIRPTRCGLRLISVQQWSPRQREFRQRDAIPLELIPSSLVQPGSAGSACTLARPHQTTTLAAEPVRGGPQMLDVTQTGIYKILLEVMTDEAVPRPESRFFSWKVGEHPALTAAPSE